MAITKFAVGADKASFLSQRRQLRLAVVEFWARIVDNDKFRISDRLRASELIAKSLGMLDRVPAPELETVAVQRLTDAQIIQMLEPHGGLLPQKAGQTDTEQIQSQVSTVVGRPQSYERAEEFLEQMQSELGLHSRGLRPESYIEHKDVVPDSESLAVAASHTPDRAK